MRFRPMSGVRAGAIATLALALLTVAPLPAMADGPLSVKLQLGSRCLSGHKPSDMPVKVKLLRSDGKALETRHDDTTDLEWSVCFVGHTPTKGNRIQLVNGSIERTIRVPDLTVALDRVTNVVRGHAPAGKDIELAYAACDATGRCAKAPPITVRANGDGRYRRDLSSSYDIDGSDIVTASYQTSGDDLFLRDGRAPWMTVTKPDRVSLSCLPVGTTTVRLLSETGTVRATRSFHERQGCRSVSWTFRTHGRVVNVHVGDRVKASFASDATLVWPTVSVAASGYSYAVRCFPNSVWNLTISDGGGVIGSYTGTTDADGRFSQPAGYQPIPPGATLRVACESTRGDRVTASAKAT